MFSVPLQSDWKFQSQSFLIPRKMGARDTGCWLAQLYGFVYENVGYIPNEIAIFHRDNDQQNHWV